jgi:hypothetical protein
MAEQKRRLEALGYVDWGGGGGASEKPTDDTER